MYAHTFAVPAIHRRRRAFFLSCFTQQVRTAAVVPELLRAAAALAGIVAWGVILALIAG